MSESTLPRIDVLPLFPELDRALLSLLDGMSASDWERETVCRGWAVRDIAAHLLDTALRRLALQRDEYVPPAPDADLSDYSELVKFLNDLNASWVDASKRLSPRLIRDLLAWSGRQLCELLATLDPSAPARFPVAWAGEETSLNWFDLAREFTERWHHQQQIRDAVAAPALTQRRFLHPVLDTFMRGLPHHYRDLRRPAGTRLTVDIEGEAGGSWQLQSHPGGWRLGPGDAGPADARILLTDEVTWRLFTNAVPRDQAEEQARIEGDRALALKFLSARSVMV